jgi:hypothetical protein
VLVAGRANHIGLFEVAVVHGHSVLGFPHLGRPRVDIVGKALASAMVGIGGVCATGT